MTHLRGRRGHMGLGRREFTPLRAPASTLGLCQPKRPRAVEDFCSRAEETYRVIPPWCDRQAVLDLAVAPAELDGDRTSRTFFCGEAVHRIDIVLVRLEITLAVVDGQ